jgi:hypothetical protein
MWVFGIVGGLGHETMWVFGIVGGFGDLLCCCIVLSALEWLAAWLVVKRLLQQMPFHVISWLAHLAWRSRLHKSNQHLDFAKGHV